MMKERLIYVQKYIKRPTFNISAKMCMCDLEHVILYHY